MLLLASIAQAASSIAPPLFTVEFNTNVPAAEPIRLEIHRSEAPIGVDRFWALLQASFFDDSAFFRYVPAASPGCVHICGGVVQFGVAGTPAANAPWENSTIADDPVTASNTRGTIAYGMAGANSRTSQLYFNLGDNPLLDDAAANPPHGPGFATFGVITSGLSTARALLNPTPGNLMGIDSDEYAAKGNAWLRAHYPNTSFITTVTCNPPCSSSSSSDRARQVASVPAPPPPSCAGRKDVEYGHLTVVRTNTTSAVLCCAACEAHRQSMMSSSPSGVRANAPPCQSWTWKNDGRYASLNAVPANCFLKSDGGDASKKLNRTSGIVVPPPTPPPPARNVSTGLSLAVHDAKPLTSTDATRYVGWTIDTSSGRQFFQIDFAAEKMRYLASQLPSFVRIGGSGNDYLQYFPCSSLPPAYGKNCLNTSQWSALTGFIEASGAQMVFGINICNRKPAVNATTNSSSSSSSNTSINAPLTTCPTGSFPGTSWEPSNARGLLEWSLTHKIPIFGVELGNERNAPVKDGGQSPQQQARDFEALHALLVELWPAPPALPPTATSRPWLLGPDTHSCKDDPTKWPDAFTFITDFFAEVEALGFTDAFHGVTHHEYIEVDATNFDNASRLDFTSRIGTLANETRSKVLKHGALWAGEIGPHNGGSSVCSHTSMRWANFRDVIWYADALASKAKSGYQVFARQDFVGIDYGLLDCVTHDPLPDYFVAVLFHRLMGSGVLRLSPLPTVAVATRSVTEASESIISESLRAYAHCGRTSGVTLLLISLNARVTVSLPAGVATTGRLDYVLAAVNGSMAGAGAKLNGGAPLVLDAAGKLPSLEGVAGVGNVIVLEPHSVAFVVLPEAQLPACVGSNK